MRYLRSASNYAGYSVNAGPIGSPSEGVTSADRRTSGQVFGSENLFVADGSIVPTAVGANPTATISALSEMVAEGITSLTLDAIL